MSVILYRKIDFYGDWLFPALSLLLTLTQTNIYGLVVLGLITAFWFYMGLKTFRISYDEDYIYLKNLFQTLQIPREDVKDIYRDHTIFHTTGGMVSSVGYKIIYVKELGLKEKIVMVSTKYRQVFNDLKDQLVEAP